MYIYMYLCINICMYIHIYIYTAEGCIGRAHEPQNALSVRQRLVHILYASS